QYVMIVRSLGSSRARLSASPGVSRIAPGSLTSDLLQSSSLRASTNVNFSPRSIRSRISSGVTRVTSTSVSMNHPPGKSGGAEERRRSLDPFSSAPPPPPLLRLCFRLFPVRLHTVVGVDPRPPLGIGRVGPVVLVESRRVLQALFVDVQDEALVLGVERHRL